MLCRVKRTSAVVVLAVMIGLCLVSGYGVAAAPKEDPTIPRILLVGDSWPWFLSTGFVFWTYENGSAFRDVLPQMGYGRWSDKADTAIAGSMITEWSTNIPTATPYGSMGRLEFIRYMLTAFPTLDIVHLGLGGNDYIRGDFRGFRVHGAGPSPTRNFNGKRSCIPARLPPARSR